ncbi:MAG: hypothetical protein DNFNHJIP_00585 [Candidatus Argoarchaeum ethanivorans]|uniref:Uncharacterized protein n=1 Tax=Candidatus Argoarchaeum ethanivorans TaxID=2608793 RepID=A0A812A0V2_9EURY|nr:MAG: hypothetical protein DNFNHJIP_00585 [Candidatus Argoarchaeum ethanivorans]
MIFSDKESDILSYFEMRQTEITILLKCPELTYCVCMYCLERF